MKQLESVVPQITRVHDLRAMDMDSAYDESQCNEAIRHGDVMLVEDGIAILDLAWPVMIFGTSDVFHVLSEDSSWSGILHRPHDIFQQQRLLDGFLVAWALACG